MKKGKKSNTKTVVIILVGLAFIITSLTLLVVYLTPITNYIFPTKIVLNKEVLNRHIESLRIGLSIVTGIAAFAALIIAYMRANASMKSVDNQTEQIQLSRETQLNEQFKTAIEHLNNENRSTIIAGIYELLQIAKTDRSSIFKEVVLEILLDRLEELTNNDKFNNFCKHIMAALADETFKEYDKKISNIQFISAPINGITFINFTFENCLIFGANYKNIKFKNCLFHESKLDKAWFNNTEIINCNFDFSIIHGVIFNECVIHLNDSFQLNILDCHFNAKTKLINLNYLNIFGCSFSQCEIVDVVNCYFIECVFSDSSIKRKLLEVIEPQIQKLYFCKFQNLILPTDFFELLIIQPKSRINSILTTEFSKDKIERLEHINDINDLKGISNYKSGYHKIQFDSIRFNEIQSFKNDYSQIKRKTHLP